MIKRHHFQKEEKIRKPDDSVHQNLTINKVGNLE